MLFGQKSNQAASNLEVNGRIPLELIAKIYLAHLRLLTSNLGKKASRNLGAIQTDATVCKKENTHRALLSVKGELKIGIGLLVARSF